jgi:hypothetical protein
MSEDFDGSYCFECGLDLRQSIRDELLLEPPYEDSGEGEPRLLRRTAGLRAEPKGGAE